MNNLDVGLVIGAGVFVVLGMYWGLIRQVLSIVGLIVGVALAGQFGPNVADWLSSFIGDSRVAGIVGFVAVLVLVSSIASIAASLLRIFAGLLFLGWLDHLLGGVLGLIQAILAGAIILIGMITFPTPAWSSAVETSLLAGWIVQVGQFFTLMLPEMFDAAVRRFLGQ
ncbi:Colicin V production protein [Oscillochloris trichoides DG-6]|uniref:Colicin V production protein n=1 Tax=Oscillochloris trichoides DG-6 TaxID=765420 RepID=E1II53_9CHLR|nr:CvpA family protein [Oscillochloris trichoides]EFO79171.1 Colicin V production protein [Oscillochloris trichoides DG-6]